MLLVPGTRKYRIFIAFKSIYLTETIVYKEIAGLLRKIMMMMMNMMTRKCEIACEQILAWQTGGR